MITNLATSRRHLAAVLLAAALLSGCKTLSTDGSLSVVAEAARSELRKDVGVIRSAEDAEAVRTRVAMILKKPLTADAAVQIAILNNRGLQAAYNALGIAEAEMVQATLPPAPTLSLERMSNAFELEIERRIIGSILGLATLPVRASIAADRFEQAKLRAIEATLRVAAEARRNYYRAVAARQAAALLDRAKLAAENASTLARRLGETGAMNKVDQAREQLFYADITAQLGTARLRMASERERLIRSMGLWGEELAFVLPGFLPELPRRPQAMPEVEAEAVRRRIDLQIARLEIEALGKTYGLAHGSRFVNLLELAGIGKTVADRGSGTKERSHGFEVELQIPIFDLGETRVRIAEQAYMQAVNRLAQKAINVRSEARDAYLSYRAAYDLARHHRDEVMPLRKIISSEVLLRYNAMLIDVFALLAEARQRIAANNQAVEAQRDFWLAAVELGIAITVGGGETPGSAVQSAPTTAAPAAAH